ncbi:putative dynamin-like GTPase Dnm1 [Syncephalis plumigaleata]|nr:putative dynamin-like GTPase Dnm1 [Syncephalis plumigaleata]
MDDLIPVVNKLQDVFNTIGSDQIDLPQIVVVGSQSAGKSSVLENIVGRDFLPRGSGIVTRRPLVLQLVNLPGPAVPSDISPTEAKSTPGIEEWAEFLHLPGQKFTRFSDVRDEIERETARLAGSNKGIVRQPIHLKIFSSGVVNLTLVDLPGLTKIPVGDQPTDIEKQTRALVLDFISKPNSVILAVSPANVDLVNSESLKLAKEVDPEGRRTIGVLTKVDLMDAGTNALDMLTGRVYHLRLGFIGVVNRSQQDISTSKPIDAALQHERDFFASHPAYRSISKRCGTEHLTKTLNQILISHIRERLPDIKARLNTLISATQQELLSYGDIKFIDQEHKGTLVLRLLTKFANDFNSSVEGTSSEITTTELSGGARIYYIFNNIFGTALDSLLPCGNLTSHDIRTAIRNSTGPRPSLFVPEIAFDLLVKPQIRRLEPPSLRCVELAYEELVKICHICGNRAELRRYPKFQAKLIEVVTTLLRERLSPTSEYVESLISIQRAYINTNHPDFICATQQLVLNDRRGDKKKRTSDRGNKRAQTLPSGINGLDAASAHLGSDSEDRDERRHPRTRDAPHSSPASEPHASQQSGDFLNYFFGNRPTGRPSDMLNTGHDAATKEMIMPGKVHDPTAIPEMKSLSISEDGPQLTDREEAEVQLIRSLITSYFNIVRKSIQDLVPKAIMHLLVDQTRDAVQNRLVAALYRENIFDTLLQEDEAIAAERARCQSMLDVYNRAFSIISEVI